MTSRTALALSVALLFSGCGKPDAQPAKPPQAQWLHGVYVGTKEIMPGSVAEDRLEFDGPSAIGHTRLLNLATSQVEYDRGKSSFAYRLEGNMVFSSDGRVLFRVAPDLSSMTSPVDDIVYRRID